MAPILLLRSLLLAAEKANFHCCSVAAFSPGWPATAFVALLRCAFALSLSACCALNWLNCRKLGKLRFLLFECQRGPSLLQPQLPFYCASIGPAAPARSGLFHHHSPVRCRRHRPTGPLRATCRTLRQDTSLLRARNSGAVRHHPRDHPARKAGQLLVPIQWRWSILVTLRRSDTIWNRSGSRIFSRWEPCLSGAAVWVPRMCLCSLLASALLAWRNTTTTCRR